MTASPVIPIDCGNGITATADLAHVAGIAPGSAGRTIVLVTLSGGEVLPREAVAERVIAALREAVAPAPAVNRLAAVFAHLSQPAPPQAATEFVPAIVMEPASPAPVALSPYDAPFVLAPLHRPAV